MSEHTIDSGTNRKPASEAAPKRECKRRMVAALRSTVRASPAKFR